MQLFSRAKITATLLSGVITLGSGVSLAQEETVEVKIPKNSVLSDGVISKKEMAKYLVIGNKQLAYLARNATEEYAPELEGKGQAMPSAWMLMSDGITVKKVSLDESADGAPPQIRIAMFRAALKSIARRGKINAAVIVYAGKLSEDNPQEVLVLEHEHRLGISATKIVPFEIDGGNVKYAEPVTNNKPFQMFYDDKGQAPSTG
ncbi:hypothetical protein [Marinobacter sp. F4218]|uniref:hypothetical protein n=1 Tax=Marinobacter sp. F4218 TaxID=2862868 RepID=UPI001C632FC1|nr:hypothetical protein [Marinobacter sp. F4218]MBW7470002.1 hypothetical protein [Marinobacter sp. F4218]